MQALLQLVHKLPIATCTGFCRKDEYFLQVHPGTARAKMCVEPLCCSMAPLGSSICCMPSSVASSSSGSNKKAQQLTASNTKQLIQQKALSTAIWANHHHRNHRTRDASEDCKSVLIDRKSGMALHWLDDRHSARIWLLSRPCSVNFRVSQS